MQSHRLVSLGAGKRAILQGDSDDDGQPNTYDYDDSFIDDEDAGKSDITKEGPDKLRQRCCGMLDGMLHVHLHGHS